MGTFKYDSWAYNNSSSTEIVPILIEKYKPQSVIDIGCGQGEWLREFLNQGVPKIHGMDNSAYDSKKFHISEKDYTKLDLTNTIEIDEKYDIALSLEVAEHIDRAYADEFIKSLCKVSDLVVFSAAIPGQGGQYHVNEQWPDYWESKFEANGFYLHEDFRLTLWENTNIHWWYRQNIIIYARSEKHQPRRKVHRLVHPELFLYRSTEIGIYKSGEIGIKSTFKSFFNAIVYKLINKPSFFD